MFELSGRRPNRWALLAMLTITMTGTMAGSMLNAPLPDIQAEFLITDSQVILPVAIFTVMMVICTPIAGWLCDRLGPVRVLIFSISVMAITQFAAAFSESLVMLTTMRALSGAACSTFPPGVQRSLVMLWPERARTSLTAWASSIGLGMAVGPAMGGLVADFMGWRWIFVFHAAVCVLLVIYVALAVPVKKRTTVELHGWGMTVLVATMGSTIVAITLVGQRVGAVAEITLALLACLGIVLLFYLAARSPDRLFPPRVILEKRYLRGTVVSGVTMFILGVLLVCLPLYLGEMGLTSGVIGMLLFTLAFSMMLSGSANTWLTSHTSSRLTLQIGLVLLILTPLLLGVWVAVMSEPRGSSLVLMIILLILTGVGLNAAQGISAFAISKSVAAQNSILFGIHNTLRFLGLASGYAWAALMLSVSEPVIVLGGPAVMAAVALLIVIIGGPLDRVSVSSKV